MILIKRWIKSISFIFILVIAIIYLYHSEVFYQLMSGDIENLYGTVNDHFAFLLIVTFMIILIQNTFTIIPLILILTKNIAVFGFFYGVLWSWFFSIIAAAIVFVSIRYLFKNSLQARISNKIMEKAEANGFMYVFFARVFPLVPTSIINMVSGVSTIKFKDFILATSLGNFIYFFVLSLVPLGFLNGSFDQNVLFLIVGLAVIIFYFYNKHKKQERLLQMKAINGS